MRDEFHPKTKEDETMKKTATVTRYQVCTADYKIIIRKGFTTWMDAHDYALMYDWGQYAEHGGLVAAAYTARA